MLENIDLAIGREVSMRIADLPSIKWNYVASLMHDLSELFQSSSRICEPMMIKRLHDHCAVYMETLIPQTSLELRRIDKKITLPLLDDIMEALEIDAHSWGEEVPDYFADVDKWRKAMAEIMLQEMEFNQDLTFDEAYEMYRVFKIEGKQAAEDHHRYMELLCNEILCDD